MCQEDLDSLLVVYLKLSHLSQKQSTLSEEEEDSARRLLELLAKNITNGDDAGTNRALLLPPIHDEVFKFLC
jgi:hypothetical protein